MEEKEIDDQGMRDENIHISDVIEVIETDPDFRESPSNPTRTDTTMFNGGGEVPNFNTQPGASGVKSKKSKVASGYRIQIIEQPAPKALRFRYECEGRSAGSIPGISSTPENKTYPTIRVVGGPPKPGLVVVSCVTKDDYRAHPHNLVGREGCKKGVCTLPIPADTMTVSFSNLGIQCVKKKDIDGALKLRESIRVDPFQKGFRHRSQPTTIDLNAVRLCFQVFLEDESMKIRMTVPPVVSEPIYDKKAMSDLNIIKLSDCVSSVDGGTRDIILLCEKVAKEDIQVRFYEEQNGQVVWEAYPDIQPSQVHKQHAIWFRTPPYKTVKVTEKVPVFIQLKRPSDGATSDPLPFELWPLDSGRPTYWTMRRHLARKYSFRDLFTNNNNNTSSSEKRVEPNNNNPVVSNASQLAAVQDDSYEPIVQNSQLGQFVGVESNQKSGDLYASIVRNRDFSSIIADQAETSYGDIINQVAELDEIYSDTQTRLLNTTMETSVVDSGGGLERGESFDDTKTYSSLQLAFKNPLEIEEDVLIDEAPLTPPPLPPTPSAKRRDAQNEEKLPPLPPKRAKKVETYIGGSMSSIQLTGKQAENCLLNRQKNGSFRAMPVSRSQSFTLASRPTPPPPPKNDQSYQTLPNPKKKSFFSKLFGKKTKAPSTASPTPAQSTKSLQVEFSLGKSQGNLSQHSTNSVRIPLKDDSPTQSQRNLKDVGEADINLDLTEAEHYALYTTFAPHATQSEFDETSCYYAPVEGGRILPHSEVITSRT